MEEEKKDSKMESAAEKRDKVHMKINKKYFLLILIFIALGIGLFITLRETGVINKYVYEEVGNLAEREGVCFDNLLFSCLIGLERGSQWEKRWICIMNNGDVYVFSWNLLSTWNIYYNNNEITGYDEANWEKMENVVYLGRFSDRAIGRLNSYVENYNVNGEHYYLNPPQDTGPQGEGSQQVPDDIGAENKGVELRSYSITLYWHEQSEKWLSNHALIERSNMIPTWWGGYEKEIQERSLDENAIAAIELFESSGFYDRWVKMCLNGY